MKYNYKELQDEMVTWFSIGNGQDLERVQKMNETSRWITYLHYKHKFTADEIAEDMELPKKFINQILSIVFNRLVKHWNE